MNKEAKEAAAIRAALIKTFNARTKRLQEFVQGMTPSNPYDVTSSDDVRRVQHDIGQARFLLAELEAVCNSIVGKP